MLVLPVESKSGVSCDRLVYSSSTDSFPAYSKQLIVSIGTECYVTLPKGQIIPTHQGANHPNAPPVPGGGHVLIVPITHYPTYLSIPPDLADPILDETEK